MRRPAAQVAGDGREPRGAAAPRRAAAALAGSTPRRRLVPAWFDRPSWSDVGPIAWFRARIDETPIRPDRSASLSHEGRGRLDRLDLWLLIVLVVAAMGLRMFRLAEPARMHFDEVYHARTAAEFLQDWRYGISHYIYEWTHPHLAKYAMAGGIVAVRGSRHAGDQRPRRAGPRRGHRAPPAGPVIHDRPRRRPRLGRDRLGADRLRPAHAQAGRLVERGWRGRPGLRQRPEQLYVGTDGGELLALDLASLDGLDAGSIDQILQPELVATLDGPISRLAPFDDGSHLAAILPDDTVVIVDPDTGTETGRAVVPGAVDMAAAGSAQAIVGAPAQVDDPAAVAAELASILGGDAASFEDRLADTEQETVVVAPVPTGDVRAKLRDGHRRREAARDLGRRRGPAGRRRHGRGHAAHRRAARPRRPSTSRRRATGLALVTSIDDGTQLYVTSRPTRRPATRSSSIIAVTAGEAAKAGP